MQYRSVGENRISALGFGCMRLPQNDRELCGRLIDRAIENGINYFDTAFMYSGNEALLGDLLKKHNRSDIYIATKLPPMVCFSGKDFEKVFRTELKRLQTDYVDFYLIHCLADCDAWRRLCNMGIKEWIEQKKKSGEIRNIGFSYHGGAPEFKKLIDDYSWDFTQLQFNYMDENAQAGREGVEYAAARGIPVIVMEPLRGGSLTYKLPQDAKDLLESRGMNAARLGLRWVLSHSEIACVLSGMNADEQLDENLITACGAETGCLSETELETVEEIKRILRASSAVGCTGCGYCMPCPQGVAIPSCFEARNSFEANKANKKAFALNPARRQYMHATGILGNNPVNASKCVKCGLCEKKCPQHLEIRKHLEDTVKVLEPAWFMLPLRLFGKFNSRNTGK